MGSNDDILFRINFLHTFFNDGKFKNFTVTPDALTKQNFLNQGLVFKSAIDGFTIYFLRHHMGNLRIREDLLRDNIQFNFKINCSDQYLLNYTDEMPLDIESGIFFFTYPISGDADQTGLLHRNEYVGASDLIDNSQFEVPYFSKPFGHIRITADEGLPQKLKIQFNSPTLYWRYIIRTTELMDYKGLAISNKKKTIFFIGPQSIILPNGENAFAFTSPSPLIFEEIPEMVWQLLEQYEEGRDSERVIISALPIPQKQHISYLGKELSDFSANRILEIFV